MISADEERGATPLAPFFQLLLNAETAFWFRMRHAGEFAAGGTLDSVNLKDDQAFPSFMYDAGRCCFEMLAIETVQIHT